MLDSPVAATHPPQREPQEEDDSTQSYQGPAFDDLDMSLQQAFYDYLDEVAGINDAFSDNLTELADAKEEVEYVHWLEEVHEFVSKQQED